MQKKCEPVDRTKECKFLTLLPNGSSLGLWHRPQLVQISQFRDKGVSLVVTIQGGTERAYEIKRKCQQQKIKWYHLPVPGASVETLKYESAKIIQGVYHIFKQMCQNKERVLVHCAAGIHRTGVVAYSLLRARGFNNTEAMLKIKAIREATYNGVGKGRIRIAQFQIIPMLVKKVKTIRPGFEEVKSEEPESGVSIVKEESRVLEQKSEEESKAEVKAGELDLQGIKD